MFRYDVKKSDGSIGFTGTFATSEEGNQWVSDSRANKVWGEESETLEVVATDTSELEAALAQLEESREARNVGSAVLDQIRTMNKQKTLAGADILGLFADPSNVRLLFLLLTGSLTLAKTAIRGVSAQFYNDDDKALLIRIIDQSGLAD